MKLALIRLFLKLFSTIASTHCILGGVSCACQRMICLHRTGEVVESCIYQPLDMFEKPNQHLHDRKLVCLAAVLSFAFHTGCKAFPLILASK